MMGTTHRASGIAAWLTLNAAAPVVHVHPHPLVTLAGTALAAGGAYLPDLDQPGSTAARSLGVVSGAVSRVLHWAFGHRGLTHTLVATLVVGLASGGVAGALSRAVTALTGVPSLSLWWAGLAVSTGYLAALAGDAATIHGIPFWAPLSTRVVHLLPPGLRMHTGYRPELMVVAPLLWVTSASCGLYLAAGWAHLPVPLPWVLVLAAVTWVAALGDGWRRARSAEARREGESARRQGAAVGRWT